MHGMKRGGWWMLCVGWFRVGGRAGRWYYVAEVVWVVVVVVFAYVCNSCRLCMSN